MTREEANWYIDSLKLTIKQNCLDEKYIEAIEALKDEPCEDAVSREQAIKQCGFGMTSLLVADCLRRLPSVTPKQRTGKWEKAITLGRYRCSVCKGEHNDSEKGKWYEIFDTCAYNFCPNCGAKMEGESE